MQKKQTKNIVTHYNSANAQDYVITVETAVIDSNLKQPITGQLATVKQKRLSKTYFWLLLITAKYLFSLVNNKLHSLNTLIILTHVLTPSWNPFKLFGTSKGWEGSAIIWLRLQFIWSEAGPASFQSLARTKSCLQQFILCAGSAQWACSQHKNISCPTTHIWNVWASTHTLLLPHICVGQS